jgi:hypothetical protein
VCREALVSPLEGNKLLTWENANGQRDSSAGLFTMAKFGLTPKDGRQCDAIHRLLNWEMLQ